MRYALLTCLAAWMAAGTSLAQETDPRVGPEVSRICFGSSIGGWRTLGNVDDVILLKRRANDWYRVELSGACDNYVLRSAFKIGLKKRSGVGCVTRGDIIVIENQPSITRQCFITKINEWNEDADDNEVENEGSYDKTD